MLLPTSVLRNAIMYGAEEACVEMGARVLPVGGVGGGGWGVGGGGWGGVFGSGCHSQRYEGVRSNVITITSSAAARGGHHQGQVPPSGMA